MMNNYYFLYRLNNEGDAEIYGKFASLSEAKLSAYLLRINESSFILSGDLTKIYFCDTAGNWEYDLFTDIGRKEFLEIYPDPSEYKSIGDTND